MPIPTPVGIEGEGTGACYATLGSDFENLVKISRTFPGSSGALIKRRGRIGLRRGRRAELANLAFASSARTSVSSALRQHCPKISNLIGWDLFRLRARALPREGNHRHCLEARGGTNHQIPLRIVNASPGDKNDWNNPLRQCR